MKSKLSCARAGAASIASCFLLLSGPVLSAGTIAASPDSCAVPTNGTCSTTINWNTSGETSASVWVSDSRYPSNAPGNFAATLSGSQLAPWIQQATYTFVLRRGTTVSGVELARTTVTGVVPSGSIGASPNSCQVPQGGTCSTTISWNTQNVSNASVWVTDSRYPNNAPGNLANGISGSVQTPWIQVASYTFYLRNGSTWNSPELSQVTVIGDAMSTPSPSCTSVAPQASSTTSISGSFRIYAYGVTNATSVTFPTWGSPGEQDDLIWYNGINAGGGTWYADVNLANHKANAPEYGAFYSDVYLNNASQSNIYCGRATWSRTQPPPAVGGNLITNGGFELPNTSSYVYPTAGALPSWTISGGVAVQRNGSAWGAPNAPEGFQTAVLQGAASMSQTLNLSAGQYTLRFKAAPRASWGGPQTISVRLNGATLQNLTPTGTTFTQYLATLDIINSGNNTIALVGTNSTGDNSAFVDDVQLTALSSTGSAQMRGGSVYNWYYMTAIPNCAREDYGIVRNYHALAPTSTPWSGSSVRSIVQGQLAQMAASGQKTLSTRLYLGGGTGSGGTLEDFTSGLSQQYLTNLKNFAADIKAAGFEEFIAEMTWVFNEPWQWSTFNAPLANSWWNAVGQIREKLISSGMNYQIGLGGELMPPNNGSAGWKTWAANLWSQYVSAYGKSDTYGFSIACDLNCGPQGNGDSGWSRVMSIPNIYGVHIPNRLSIHMYENPADVFTLSDSSLNALGLTTVPIQIGETWYNSAASAEAFRIRSAQTGRSIAKVIQWPLTETPSRETSLCTQTNLAVPSAFDEYLSRGF